jgi:small-conductance mechanosensitive channel
MKWLQSGIVITLLLLALAAAGGYLLTRDSAATKPTAETQAALVDQRPLQTAQRLAALAATADEQRVAQEAARLGDHAVDLAFADALMEAAAHPADKDPKFRDQFARIQKIQATLNDEQAHLAQLNIQLAAAKASDKDALQDRIAMLQAQVDLDEDDLEDAKGDLIRAGGDPQGKIERLRAEHEAREHGDSSSTGDKARTTIDLSAPTLMEQVRAWKLLRDKSAAFESAREESAAAAQVLSVQHNAIQKLVAQEATERDVARRQATGQAASNPTTQSPATTTIAAAVTAAAPASSLPSSLPSSSPSQAPGSSQSSLPSSLPSSPPTSSDTLTSLKRFATDQRELADYNKRIQDEQDLASNYSKWNALVAGERRTVYHGMFGSLLWILLIVLLVYLACDFIDRYFSGESPERKRLFTLRSIIRFSVQSLGVLLIGFVVFGMPREMPTILGLAGAGLTVALKDFIVGFVGWFVLMGRNGIRVGDWVEINGVMGEVIEIGLLRTVLLETGNWTDTGHPTGRKVAFVNSYAIEGHFFNFSTAGQWLWDELQVEVAQNENPYPLVESIQKLVEQETRASAAQAEQEWQKSVGYRKSLTASPAIHLRPTASGVEMQVRYITSANERYATRSKLYEKIVALLRGEAVPAVENKA